MALGSLVAHLAAGGLGALSETIRKNKLEKKINSGIVEIDDLLFVGGYYFTKKDYLKAEAYAKTALDIKPDSYEAKNLLFNIYYSKADWEKALKIIELQLKENKDTATHLFNMGYCYFKLDQIEKANEFKNKASELDASMGREVYR